MTCPARKPRAVYVATSFLLWRNAERVAQLIEEHGHHSTSRWIAEARRLDGRESQIPIRDPRRLNAAMMDVCDIHRSDTFLLIVPSEGGCGCWYELGVATAAGKRVMVVGDADMALGRSIFLEGRTIYPRAIDAVGAL